MMNNIEDIQKAGKESMDVAMQSMTAMSKGFQALAIEASDYTKKSVEESTAAAEKLMASGSLDKAMEVQTDYAKTAYEGFVGQVTKVNDMIVDMAKESYKPYEDMFGKLAK